MTFETWCVQVPTHIFNLPPTTAAVARRMFKVDNGKLQVLDREHKHFKGSQVKALDYVVAVNGKAMDPQDLLKACVSDEVVELKLQRDRNNTQQKKNSAVLLFVLMYPPPTISYKFNKNIDNRIARRKAS